MDIGGGQLVAIAHEHNTKTRKTVCENRNIMKSRNERMEVLRLILSNTEVGSQEALLKELEAEGYKVTQATLSRDLQKLKAAKVASPTGYKYMLPDNPLYRHRPTSDIPDFIRNTGYLGIEFSGNIGLLRTRSGYAISIAAEIDNRKFDSIVGTISGDDSILILIREGYTRENVIENLAIVLPAIRNKN